MSVSHRILFRRKPTPTTLSNEANVTTVHLSMAINYHTLYIQFSPFNTYILSSFYNGVDINCHWRRSWWQMRVWKFTCNTNYETVYLVSKLDHSYRNYQRKIFRSLIVTVCTMLNNVYNKVKVDLNQNWETTYKGYKRSHA